MVLTSLWRTSSGTLRVMLHKARVDECEKTTGAWLISRVWCIVAVDPWDRSTIIPNRFISLITTWYSHRTTDPRFTTPSEERNLMTITPSRSSEIFRPAHHIHSILKHGKGVIKSTQENKTRSLDRWLRATTGGMVPEIFD